jgi:hypothetical protein
VIGWAIKFAANSMAKLGRNDVDHDVRGAWKALVRFYVSVSCTNMALHIEHGLTCRVCDRSLLYMQMLSSRDTNGAHPVWRQRHY